jgi:hypothetical protein
MECVRDGESIPCRADGGGIWNGRCYEKVVSTDPWDSDPWHAYVWESVGHAPGVLVQCQDSLWNWLGGPRWRPTADPPPSAAQLTNAALAAIAGVVHAPGLGLFPGGALQEDDPDIMGLVNVPAWFWAVDPGPGIASDDTMFTTVGGYALAATVKFRKTVYDPGEGDPVVCHSLGDDPDHKIHVPTIPPHGCYHTYERKGIYHVTATTYFDIEWSGAGRQGTVAGLTVVQEADYRIGEIRVLIVNR